MSTRKKIKNVFEAILEYGHDEDFVPYEGETFVATDAPAGSEEKIEAIAADQHVAAKPTAEDIVTCETIDEVVTLQARDDVASRCPDQDVVAGSSHDRGDFTSAQNALLGPNRCNR